MSNRRSEQPSPRDVSACGVYRTIYILVSSRAPLVARPFVLSRAVTPPLSECWGARTVCFQHTRVCLDSRLDETASAIKRPVSLRRRPLARQLAKRRASLIYRRHLWCAGVGCARLQLARLQSVTCLLVHIVEPPVCSITYCRIPSRSGAVHHSDLCRALRLRSRSVRHARASLSLFFSHIAAIAFGTVLRRVQHVFLVVHTRPRSQPPRAEIIACRVAAHSRKLLSVRCTESRAHQCSPCKLAHRLSLLQCCVA